MFLSLAITPGNGVCPAPINSCPTASSPPRQQHVKPNHAYANGRARLSSRSGSLSHAGSPRPSLTRQPSAATDAGGDGSKPNDYLIWAILACLCPVWPINIVGLTFSVMVCVLVFVGRDVWIQFLSSKEGLRFNFKNLATQCLKVTFLPLESELKTSLTGQETVFCIILSYDNGILWNSPPIHSTSLSTLSLVTVCSRATWMAHAVLAGMQRSCPSCHWWVGLSSLLLLSSSTGVVSILPMRPEHVKLNASLELTLWFGSMLGQWFELPVDLITGKFETIS